MIKQLREIRDLINLQRQRKDIVIYSEGSNYYPNFEGLIKELDSVHYITSDSNDPIIGQPDTYRMDRLLPFYMAFANCKILIMTMTDLNTFHIKRSINQVHYVYVFHSLASTHMVYRYRAFDHYDSILCAGPHQVEEIRKNEKLYGLKPKNLLSVGYYPVERLHDAYKRYKRKNQKLTVLIAPSWGPTNLLEVCGKELIETLLKEDYKVVLRLHPETAKKHNYNYAGVTLETSVASVKSLVEADVLITSWSAIGLEYAFGTERPVVYIDTPPKIRNPRYKELDIEPLESHLRDKIGVVVPSSELSTLPGIISDLVSPAYLHNFSSGVAELRNKYVFNFGESSKVGADYIRGLL